MVNPKQIQSLARAIVNRLEDRGMAEFSDAETGIEIVTAVLTENFRIAETIAAEARTRLARESPDRDPEAEALEEEMRKIAVERDFAL